MMQSRPIGTIESTFLLIHDHFGGSYTGAVAVEIEGPLDPDTAMRSLRALVARHPLLRARLEVPADGTPQLVVRDDVEVAPFVEVSDFTEDDARRALEDAAGGFWDRAAALWRCRLLSKPGGREHFFVFAAHHTIGDGLSKTYVIRDFLVGCAKLLRGEPIDRPALDLLPPIEHLAEATKDVKRDWEQVLKIAAGHLGRSEFPYPIGAPPRAERTSVESMVLDEDRTAAVLAACRARRTPLTGLLTAALCEAVREVFSSSGDFLLACPMSCRPLSRKVRLDDSQFGCYTRVAYVHSSAEPLWPRAGRISQRLDVLSKAATFSMNPRFRGAQRVFRLASRIRRHGFTDLAVSNLGIVDFPKSAFAPFEVRALRLCANMGGAFEMFLLATCLFQKKLTLNLAFPEPHMIRATARETFDALVRTLTNEGSRPP